jgi:hypothetical protein
MLDRCLALLEAKPLADVVNTVQIGLGPMWISGSDP